MPRAVLAQAAQNALVVAVRAARAIGELECVRARLPGYLVEAVVPARRADTRYKRS